MYENSSIPNITPSDFPDLCQNKNVATIFSVPWCGHCKKLEPEIIKAHDRLIKDKVNIKIVHVDCEAHKDVPQKINASAGASSSDIKISGYPTIIFHKDGKSVNVYEGERSADKLYTECKKFAT